MTSEGTQLIHALDQMDRALAKMHPSQVLGILFQEKDLGNETARLLWLAHKHALDQIDEAERTAYESQFK